MLSSVIRYHPMSIFYEARAGTALWIYSASNNFRHSLLLFPNAFFRVFRNNIKHHPPQIRCSTSNRNFLFRPKHAVPFCQTETWCRSQSLDIYQLQLNARLRNNSVVQVQALLQSHVISYIYMSVVCGANVFTCRFL